MVAGLLAAGWYSGHIGNGGFQHLRQAAGLAGATGSDLCRRQHAAPGHRRDVEGPRQSHPGVGLHAGRIVRCPPRDRRLGPRRDWTPAAGPRPPMRRDAPAAAGRPGDAARAARPAGCRPSRSASRSRVSWTFDLGQNMVGVVRLRVAAPAGTKLTLRHAEMLNPDGTVYTKNLRSAASTDTYDCQGRRQREMAAHVHLPRLPLRGADRAAGQARRWMP